MKKLSILLMTLMIASFLLTSLVGCAGCNEPTVPTVPEHTHAYGNEWIMNANEHYHLCSCGEKKDTAAHADENKDAKCDACGLPMKSADPDHTEHDFSGDYVFDAENHYHLCTECGVKDTPASHNDGNNDGACDVCGVIMSNDHVYDKNWTSDATGHWHAVLCGHDVEVKDKADHTPNDFGVCSVCGYKVGEPDVSTVEKALELAALAQGKVLAGKLILTNAYGYSYTDLFEYGEGYFHSIHIDDESDEIYNILYATKNADGTICLITEDKLSTEAPITVNLKETNTKYLQGVMIDLEPYTGIASTVYGALDLLEFFYEEYIVAAPEGTVITEKVENGVYTFSYPVALTEAAYTVNAEFTLDPENYFIDSFKVSVTSGEETNNLKFEQWVSASSDMTPDDVIPTEIEIYDNDENKISFDSQNIASTVISTAITGYEHYSIYIMAPAPENALIEALGVQVSVKDKAGAAVTASDVYASFNAAKGAVQISFYTVGEYKVEIKIGNTVYTVPVNVDYADPETVSPIYYDNKSLEYVEINDENDGGKVAFVGQVIRYGALLNTGAEPNKYKVEIIGANAENATLSDAGLVDNGFGGLVQSYDFCATVSGTYTLTFTSTVDSKVKATINIVVSDPPLLKDVMAGHWSGGNMVASATADIYPTNDKKGVIAVNPDPLSENETFAIFTYYIVEEELFVTAVGDSEGVQSVKISEEYKIVVTVRNRDVYLDKNLNTAQDYGLELPEAPNPPLPGEPIVIPCPSSPMERMTFEVKETGTTIYQTTIAAGEKAYFIFWYKSIDCNVYIELLEGDATFIMKSMDQYVVEAPDPIPLNDTFWNGNLTFSNDTDASMTIVFTIDVKEAPAT